MAPIWKTFIGLSLVYWIADRDPNSVFKLAIVEPLGRICDIIPQLTRPKLSQSVLDNQEAYMTTVTRRLDMIIDCDDGGVSLIFR